MFKSRKISDPSYSFSSDCIKNGPDELFELMALLLQSIIIHGHIALYLLLATLKDTISKNKLLDACINGKGDIFEEIKRLRKTNETTATSMDGV